MPQIAVRVWPASVRDPTLTRRLFTTMASRISSFTPFSPPQCFSSPVSREMAVGRFPIAPTTQRSPNHSTEQVGRNPCVKGGTVVPRHTPVESKVWMAAWYPSSVVKRQVRTSTTPGSSDHPSMAISNITSPGVSAVQSTWRFWS